MRRVISTKAMSDPTKTANTTSISTDNKANPAQNFLILSLTFLTIRFLLNAKSVQEIKRNFFSYNAGCLY